MTFEPEHTEFQKARRGLVVDAFGTSPRDRNVTFGEVAWSNLFDADKTPTEEFVLGLAEFGPGERLLPHQHDQSEFYFCTAGAGEVTIDGQVHTVTPGKAVYLPGDTEHGVCAGPEGLTLLYGFATDRFSNIVYRFVGAREGI